MFCLPLAELEIISYRIRYIHVLYWCQATSSLTRLFRLRINRSIRRYLQYQNIGHPVETPQKSKIDSSAKHVRYPTLPNEGATAVSRSSCTQYVHSSFLWGLHANAVPDVGALQQKKNVVLWDCICEGGLLRERRKAKSDASCNADTPASWLLDRSRRSR